MEFKTTIPPHQGLFEISHDSRIMLIGSCFSNEIGNKLSQSGFHTLVNPFGTLFNPYSIGKSLTTAVRNKKFDSSDFFEQHGLWHSYKLHSKFSGIHLNESIEKINASIDEANKYIFNTDVLIITLGTAWVYELKEDGKIVANCHKMPQQIFEKRKLGINEIISEYTHIIERLKGANQKLKIIFTVSPVKHLRDGFVENNWSKSTLNIAIHELIRRFDFCDYYPAFEIVNDDLRDYRFYKEDMLHPNELATKYVFEHFQNAYFTDETKNIAKEFYQLSKSTEHKSYNTDSVENLKFINDFKSRAERLMHVNSYKVNQLLEALN
jgi:hypothetical protein